MKKKIHTALGLALVLLFKLDGRTEISARTLKVTGHEHATYFNIYNGNQKVVDYYSLESGVQAMTWNQGEPFIVSIQAPQGQAFHYTPPSGEAPFSVGLGSLIEVVLFSDQPAELQDANALLSPFTYRFRGVDGKLSSGFFGTDLQGFLQFSSQQVALYLNVYSSSRVFMEIQIEGMLMHTFPDDLSYTNEQVYLRAQAVGFDQPLLTLVSIPESSVFAQLIGLPILIIAIFRRRRPAGSM